MGFQTGFHVLHDLSGVLQIVSEGCRSVSRNFVGVPRAPRRFRLTTVIDSRSLLREFLGTYNESLNSPIDRL